MKLKRCLFSFASLALALTLTSGLDAATSRVARLSSRIAEALGTSARATPTSATLTRALATRTLHSSHDSNNRSNDGSWNNSSSRQRWKDTALLTIGTLAGGYATYKYNTWYLSTLANKRDAYQAQVVERDAYQALAAERDAYQNSLILNEDMMATMQEPLPFALPSPDVLQRAAAACNLMEVPYPVIVRMMRSDDPQIKTAAATANSTKGLMMLKETVFKEPYLVYHWIEQQRLLFHEASHFRALDGTPMATRPYQTRESCADIDSLNAFSCPACQCLAVETLKHHKEPYLTYGKAREALKTELFQPDWHHLCTLHYHIPRHDIEEHVKNSTKPLPKSLRSSLMKPYRDRPIDTRTYVMSAFAMSYFGACVWFAFKK